MYFFNLIFPFNGMDARSTLLNILYMQMEDLYSEQTFSASEQCTLSDLFMSSAKITVS